jgi:hypothetical protein
MSAAGISLLNTTVSRLHWDLSSLLDNGAPSEGLRRTDRELVICLHTLKMDTYAQRKLFLYKYVCMSRIILCLCEFVCMYVRQ